MMIATPTRGGDHRLPETGPGDTLSFIGGFRGATTFAVSPSGRYFVVIGASGELLRLGPAGTVEQRVGGFGWGGTAFDGPSDIAVPNDLEVYLADYGNDRIVKLDRSLGVSTVFETEGEKVTFRFPLSVCVTGFGRVLVVDGENGRIVEIDRENAVTRIFGTRGSGPGSLDHPVRVRADGDSLIAVQDRSGLVMFDTYGNYLRSLSRELTGNYSRFSLGDGNLAFLDSNAVRIFSVTGELRGMVGVPGPGAGEEVGIEDLFIGAGTLYLLKTSGVAPIDLKRVLRDE